MTTASVTGRPRHGARALLDGAILALAVVSIPLSLTSPGGTVAMGLIALVGLGLLLRGAEVTPSMRRAFGLAALAYCIVVLADVLNGEPLRGLASTGVNYLPLLVFTPVAVALRQARFSLGHMRLAFEAGVVCALILAVHTVVTWSQSWMVFFVKGPNLNQIPFGLIVGALGCFLLSAGLKDGGRRGRMDVVLSVAAFVIVILSASKLVWVCAALGYLIVFALHVPRMRRRTLFLVAGGVAALFLIALALPPVRFELLAFQRSLFGVLSGLSASAVNDVTITPRLEVWQAGWSAFMERPWFGWGIADRMEVVRARAPADAELIWQVNHLHSDYLTHLVAYGVAGAVALAVIFVLALRIAGPHPDPVLHHFLYAMLPAVALYMAFEIVFNMDALTGFMALLFGMVLSLRTRSERSIEH